MVQIGPIPTGGHHYDALNREETALNGISSAQAVANLRFAYPGESGQRNNFRSDGYLSIDDGLSKSFRTWREQQFKLTVEVFNVINTNRFGIPQNAGDSPNFGVYQNQAAGFNGPASLLVQPRQNSVLRQVHLLAFARRKTGAHPNQGERLCTLSLAELRSQCSTSPWPRTLSRLLCASP